VGVANAIYGIGLCRTPSARLRNDGQRLSGAEEFGQLIQRRLDAAAAVIVAAHGDRVGEHRRRIQRRQFGSDARTDGRDALGRSVGGVEGVEQELHASRARTHDGARGSGTRSRMSAPEMHPVDLPHAPVIAGAVVGQLLGAPVRVPRAEALVVAIDQAPGIVDHVQAVVRLVPVAQPVRRPDDHPDAEPAGQVEDLAGGLAEGVPSRSLRSCPGRWARILTAPLRGGERRRRRSA